jgi:membrane-bound lytic murein transglycosylase B
LDAVRRGRGLEGIAGVAAWLGFACAGAMAPPAAAPPWEPVPAPAPPPVASAPDLDARVADAKGWSWLVERLAADGVERRRAERTFADPRVPPFDGLGFSIDPAEPRSMYRAVLQRRSVEQARACASEYADAFRAAERATGVPAEVVAAILHVETRCGRNTGQRVVLFGLARLAMANEPRNLEENIQRFAGADGSVDPDLERRVRARAEELEAIFYPEVRAVFTLADLSGIHPLDLLGSASGAFGYPQFLPTSYLRFGADGSGDGRVDLYDVGDAAASAARYLASHGWAPGITETERRRAIWHYNRSDAYIDAVLGLARRLEGSVRPYYAQTPGEPVLPVEAAQ